MAVHHNIPANAGIQRQAVRRGAPAALGSRLRGSTIKAIERNA